MFLHICAGELVFCGGESTTLALPFRPGDANDDCPRLRVSLVAAERCAGDEAVFFFVSCVEVTFWSASAQIACVSCARTLQDGSAPDDRKSNPRISPASVPTQSKALSAANASAVSGEWYLIDRTMMIRVTSKKKIDPSSPIDARRW